MPQAFDSTAWMCLLSGPGVGVVLASVFAAAIVFAAFARRRGKRNRNGSRESTRHAQLLAMLGCATGFALMSGGCVLDLYSSAWANRERVGLYSAVLIGALAFATSAIALCKLRGRLSLKRAAQPGHGIVNLFAILLCGWLGYGFVTEQAQPFGLAALLATSALACAIGVHMTMSREYSATHVLATGKQGVLPVIEWHGGEEQAWVLRDILPGSVRAAAYRHRRDWHNGNSRSRACIRHRSARFATRRRL